MFEFAEHSSGVHALDPAAVDRKDFENASIHLEPVIYFPVNPRPTVREMERLFFCHILLDLYDASYYHYIRMSSSKGPDDRQIVEILEQLCVRLNLTQAQLAEKLKVSLATL